MRLFAFLLLSTALMALAIYDVYMYTEAKRAVSDIKTIGQDLDVDRQQYAVIYKKYISGGIDGSDYSAAVTSPAIVVPKNENIDFQSQAANSWHSAPELATLRQKINLSISRHQSVFELYQTKPYTDVDEQLGTDSLVGDLYRIQAQNIRLTKHISDELLRSLVIAIAVNAIVIAAVFLISFGIAFRDNREKVKINREKSKDIENRYAENQRARKMMVSIMDDLLDEKKTAEHLTLMLEERNKNIEVKNKEMEQFIYTISHDLKAPLVSIGGFSAMLNKELSENMSDKQAHYFSRIQSNVSDMDSMLGDLLDLSRISNQQLERSMVDTNAHIASLLSSFEFELKQLGCQVEVEQPMHGVYANERQLRRCLSNLISNAIAYRSKNRDLRIVISSKRDATHTIISVQDNGIGIDQKFHKLVFKIFEHLDSCVGTGIGLAIVKTVLEQHDGSVSVDSEPNRGSSFHLKFPNKDNIRKVA